MAMASNGALRAPYLLGGARPIPADRIELSLHPCAARPPTPVHGLAPASTYEQPSGRAARCDLCHKSRAMGSGSMLTPAHQDASSP
jgi:hypothetical protein